MLFKILEIFFCCFYSDEIENKIVCKYLRESHSYLALLFFILQFNLWVYWQSK